MEDKNYFNYSGRELGRLWTDLRYILGEKEANNAIMAYYIKTQAKYNADMLPLFGDEKLVYKNGKLSIYLEDKK